MGLLDFVQDFASEAGTLIGGAVGGPGGAALGGAIGRTIEGSGSSSGRSRRTRGTQRRTPGIASDPPNATGGSGFNFQLPSFGGNLNLPGLPSMGGSFTGPSGSVNVGGGGDDQQVSTTGNGNMVAGSFQGALGQMMLKKSIRSKSGRAILEAMQSGALQRGLIQQTTTVQTPRGTENHSPPGFRTVYINDQPFAVFKPLAQALRLLPKRSRAKITAADMKTIRSADRLTKKIKKVAKKTGNLKVTNK